MLVISRKIGESILIGDDIRVTIVRVSPNVVRLGIEAPGGHEIFRQELKGVPAEAEDASEAGSMI